MLSKVFHLYKKKVINFLFYLKLPITLLYNNDHENNFLILICSYNNAKYVRITAMYGIVCDSVEYVITDSWNRTPTPTPHR